MRGKARSYIVGKGKNRRNILAKKPKFSIPGLKPPRFLKAEKLKKRKALALRRDRRLGLIAPPPVKEEKPSIEELIPYQKAELKVVQQEIVKRPPSSREPCELILSPCSAELDPSVILKHYSSLGEGTIARIELPRLGRSGTGNYTGVVTFVNSLLAKKASKLPPLNLCGKALRATLNLPNRLLLKNPKEARLRLPSRKVVLIGCPAELSQVDVEQYYGKVFGDDKAVADIVWEVGPEGEYDGIAFVTFKQQTYARDALNLEPPECPETGEKVAEVSAVAPFDQARELKFDHWTKVLTEFDILDHFKELGPGAVVRISWPSRAAIRGDRVGTIRFRTPKLAAEAMSMGNIKKGRHLVKLQRVNIKIVNN